MRIGSSKHDVCLPLVATELATQGHRQSSCACLDEGQPLVGYPVWCRVGECRGLGEHLRAFFCGVVYLVHDVGITSAPANYRRTPSRSAIGVDIIAGDR